MQKDTENATTAINIEDIMRDIRTKILAKHANISGNNEPIIPTGGEYLPPEFYEHLHQAALAHGNASVKMHVTKIKVPLIGGFIEKVRGKLHELVLYYVNQSVSQQAQVTHHLLRALAIISEELEKEYDKRI